MAHAEVDGHRNAGSKRTLYAAAFGAGQVWRIGTSRQPCVLARGLAQTTSVAVGRGSRGFGRGNLYVTGYDGRVVELRGAAAGEAT